MAWQALYRKWRSRDFDELVGQEHVVTTLRNALRTGRVAHAYLFCGPRGTGKTTVARILAKAVNCLAPLEERPCNRCAICQSINEGRAMDLIEIDAASNRGIDEIRDLREKVHYAPTEMRTKFYVVDESHMLTNEAFNALLKTLEEPPAHVIFVLATTEPHKIPPTVLSRCQRFDFRRISLPQIVGHLQKICQAEGFTAEPAALEFIGRAATGSLRDAISLLDQLTQASETVTLEQTRRILGAVGSEAVGQLVDHWLAGATAEGLRLLGQVCDAGADLRQFNRQVVEHLRGLLLLKAAGDGAELLNVTADMVEIMQAQAARTTIPALVRAIRLFNQADQDLRASSRGEPLLPLELAFVEATLPSPPTTAPPLSETVISTPASPAPVRSPRPPTAPATPAPARSSRPTTAPASPAPAQPAGPSPLAPSDPLTVEQVQARWNQIVNLARGKSPRVQALLRSGQVRAVDNNTIVIALQYSFHKDQLDTPQNKRVVEEVLSQELGRACQAQFVLATENPPGDQVGDDPFLQAVMGMGGRVKKTNHLTGGTH